jgi:hypothetical protein
MYLEGTVDANRIGGGGVNASSRPKIHLAASSSMVPVYGALMVLMGYSLQRWRVTVDSPKLGRYAN